MSDPLKAFDEALYEIELYGGPCDGDTALVRRDLDRIHVAYPEHYTTGKSTLAVYVRDQNRPNVYRWEHLP